MDQQTPVVIPEMKRGHEGFNIPSVSLDWLTGGMNTPSPFLDSLLAGAGVGIIVLDTDLRYRAWNVFMERLTGCPAAEMLGQPAAELIPHLHRHGNDHLMEKALNGHTVTLPDIPFSVPDTNHNGWVTGTYSPLRNEEGDITGVLGIIHDITEKHLVDEQLQQQNAFLVSMIDSLPYPFYIIDAETYEVVQANGLAGNKEDWQGTTCHRLTHRSETPCCEKDHKCPLREVKRTKEPVILEHLHYNEHGDRRFIEIHGYPIFDETGQVVRMLEYGLDITQRKILELEKEELIGNLKDALAQVKTLNGLVPICSYCKSIRDDRGYWTQLETYLAQHSEAQLSHGICPSCLDEKYGDLLNGK